MSSATRRRGPLATASRLLATAALTLLGIGAVGPAHADDQSGSGVTVAVTPDREGRLAPGDEVVYSIEVRNDGDALEDARIVQMLPAGFQHVSADPGAEAQGTQAIWTVSLGSGDAMTLQHRVRAGTAEQIDSGRLVHVEQPDAPEGAREEQFSSTVCVHESAGAEALVCASAWQEIEREQSSAVVVWMWVGGIVAVLAVAAVAIVFWLRNRRRMAEDV